MTKLAKALVTIGMIVVFFVLFALIVVAREAGGHSTPGILGLILFAGLIGGIRAVWKKDKSDNNGNSVLQK